MWHLVRARNGAALQDSQVWMFNPGMEGVVGRKECAIQLGGKSVSREHARLRVDLVERGANAGAGEALTMLTVTDCSRFGTYINGQQLVRGERYPLTDGTVLRFGSPHLTSLDEDDELLVVKVHVLLTTSRAKYSELVELAAPVGLPVTNTPVAELMPTHLVVMGESVKPSIHVTLAMAFQMPIVTAEWVRELARRQHPQEPVPNAVDHVPAGGSGWTRPELLMTIESRSSLLAGVAVYFPPSARQHTSSHVPAYARYRDVVAQVGGQVLDEPPPGFPDVQPPPRSAAAASVTYYMLEDSPKQQDGDEDAPPRPRQPTGFPYITASILSNVVGYCDLAYFPQPASDPPASPLPVSPQAAPAKQKAAKQASAASASAAPPPPPSPPPAASKTTMEDDVVEPLVDKPHQQEEDAPAQPTMRGIAVDDPVPYPKQAPIDGAAVVVEASLMVKRPRGSRPGRQALDDRIDLGGFQPVKRFRDGPAAAETRRVIECAPADDSGPSTDDFGAPIRRRR